MNLVLLFLTYLGLQIMGAYKSWRLSNPFGEFFSVIKGIGLTFVLMTTLTHFFAREEMSRAVMVLFLVLASTGLVGARVCVRLILRGLRKKGKNQRWVLLIGDGQLVDNFTARIQARPELGIQFFGWLRLGTESQSLDASGSLEDLQKLLEKGSVDQLVVCLRNQDMNHLEAILELAALHHVYVRIVPDILKYSVLGFELEDIDGLPVVTLNNSPLVGWNAVAKRLFDICGSVALILLFSPLLLLIPLLIKLTSRGPIFYKQERMGLDGVKFQMLKFRSMVTDAEQKTGAVWASSNDGRTTTLGRWLRKTSLDELPQFFNVFVGNMSLVGPRPERPVFVDQFRSQIPGYMLRHKVKAGVTGWAQINGFRGNTSLEGRIQHDIYYITHWSLVFDLKILFLTIFRGFISPNAY